MSPEAAFPHPIEDREHLLIPLPDGGHLAARAWLPTGSGPAPAVLEYIPYRKRDGTRLRDEPMHRWFAGHGYAALRVDIRGTGESTGILTDEYSEQEQQDALAVIAWIAAQPWCDGTVAMIGKSWGGFSALQAAARRPPALRAVIAVCATDDRYADDAHYMGGCLLHENLVWGSLLMTLCAQPPDPALAGPRWRELWQQRLDHLAPFPARWLRHPCRDDYWRHGSINEDFGAIEVPVWVISGWADGYSNAVPRLLAGLRGPRWGLIGPWAHAYPHEGVPGPAIGFLQEAVRFLDRWLRGIDNGWERQPRLRAWLQDSARPAPGRTERAGRWIAEPEWPSPRLHRTTFALRGGALVDPADADPGEPPCRHQSPLAVGLAAGAWCGFGLDGDDPADQRTDDAASLCFDSAPLTGPFAILGAAEVELALAVDRPVAMLYLRLCEVFPDGASARVTYTISNLTHRHGHEQPEPLVPGERLRLRLRLNDIAHTFAAGNRLRLALSTSCWPLAWPAPAAVTVTLFPAECRLHLPVRPDHAADHSLPPPPPPRSAAAPPFTDLHPGGVRRTTTRDPASGELVTVTELDLEPDGTPSLTQLDDIDLRFGHGIRETFRIVDGDPCSAQAEVHHVTVAERHGQALTVALTARLTCTADTFAFTATLEARCDDEVVRRREFGETVPRHLV